MKRLLTLGMIVVGCGLTAMVRAQSSDATPNGINRTTNPVIITPDPQHVFTMEAGTVRILISGEQTGGAFAVIEGVEREYATNLHRHNFDEAFYVVEGTLTVHLNGETRRLPAGSYVFIPRGVPHAQGNREQTPVKNILTVTPAGFEKSFRDRVDRFAKAKQGTPEWEKITAEMQQRAQAGGYAVERLSDTSPIR